VGFTVVLDSPVAHASQLSPAESRLRTLMRILALVFFLGAIVYFVGPLIVSMQDAFRELPFVSNSVVKVSLIGMCCLYAAGDIRGRLGLVLIVILAHVVSVLAMVVELVFADTGGTLDFGFGSVAVDTALFGAIGLDGGILVLLLAFYLPARRFAEAYPGESPPPSDSALLREQKWLRGALIVLAAALAVGALIYEVGPLLDTSKNFFVELPFVTNSVVKVSTFAMLSVYVARDVVRRMSLVAIVVAGHLVSVIGSLAYLQFRDTDYTLPLLGGDVKMETVLWGATALDLVIGLTIFVFYSLAWRAVLKPVFFAPVEFRALIATADVVVTGREERVPPERIAHTIARHFAQLHAKRVWVYHAAMMGLQLHPLAYLKPPLSELEPGMRREHLEKHFRKLPKWPLTQWVRAMIRVGQQLSYAGYYNDPDTFESVGYKRFTDRVRERGEEVPDAAEGRVQVEHIDAIGEGTLEADVCIIGSGAGGAILAYELVSRGRNVLILERGPYVPPPEFTEDEVAMIGRLYGDGLMQQSSDFRFTVLQGNCVGGSTTVNNAVCFEPPQPVLERWNSSEHEAGLDLGRLADSVKHVSDFLRVQRQTPDAILNPSFPRFVDGARKTGQAPGKLDVEAVRANIEGCLGSGYCNMGCRWGKKLSMLETALPWAQERYPGKLRIVPECEVERLRTLSGKPPRILDARARLRNGGLISVRADTYVLSAGAVGSSYILLRSGIGHGLPVGKHLCFNMGAPITAQFKDKQHAYAGLQISHYGVPKAPEGFVFETWFNPPVAQSLNMPGWFEDHFEHMESYDHLMAVGVLVGTKTNAKVREALTGGPDIDYTPDKEDLAKLARGLRILAESLFADDAERVMLNTWEGDVFERGELDRLEQVAADGSRMTLGTGHPQGGNAISRDPKKGVIGPDFKVHGYDNLFVCDASVFPSSLTVNPQLTVMSLAHYAAEGIA
jgi:choline dehydrogenase-like flavoprotein